MKNCILIKNLAAVIFFMAFLIGILYPVAASWDAHMDDLTIQDMNDEYIAYDNASVYNAVAKLSEAPTTLANEFPKPSYTNWSQGECGSCWVWAGTGALAQSLFVYTGTSTPLSIQFFNSNYMDGNILMQKPHDWACTGGFASTFSDIYTTGVNQSYAGGPFVVPWSNVNASYKDSDVDGNNAQTTLPKNLITNTPNFGLSRVEDLRVLEKPYSNQTAAIDNITLALVDKKVIYYSMQLPNKTAWDQFKDFWNNQDDNKIWDMDQYNQSFFNDSAGEGSGHAMILMGYNKTDSDLAKRYWIIQNSWGNSTNRPKGQYKLKMWMDYNATFNNTEYTTQEFSVLNVTWKTDPTVSSIAPSTGHTGSISITDIEGTNFVNSADVMLKSSTLNPRHAGSLVNGTGGALLNDPARVTISGNYAYIASNTSNALEIVNLSNPFVPVHEGRIVNGEGGAYLDGPYDVAISGKYAYVASYRNDAIEIIDISNPSAPVHKSNISHGVGGALLKEPQRVVVSRNFAFVASSGSNALEIVNISNPLAPVHHASLVSGAGGGSGAKLLTPYDLAVIDDYPYVYVASFGSNALEIVNITDPAAPLHMGSVVNGAGGALLDNPWSVTVAGYNAFVTSKGNALEIIDISNQSAPVHRGSLAKTAGVAWLNVPVDAEISADWKYAYIASNGGNTLDIIDVSDPAVPVYKTGLSNGAGGALIETPSSVALYRSMVYVTSRGNDALEVIAVDSIPATGISVSSTTSITGSFNLTGAPSGSWNLVVTNVNSRFATLSNGFTVTQVPEPTPPPQPSGGDGDDEDVSEDKEAAITGPSGQASVSIKTNDLGQTLAPYSVETTLESPIDVEVSIPQSTKSLTAQGQPISEVTVTPVSQEAVSEITGSTTSPEGTVFAAGGLGVVCSPAGATFDQMVTITFTMTGSQWDTTLAQANGKSQDITIQYYDNTAKTWVSLPTSVDLSTQTVTTTTKHFSLFAVFVKVARTASSAPTLAAYSRETPAAVIHTPAGIVPTETPVPAPPQSTSPLPVVTIVAIIAGLATLIGCILLLRRWWIRRQNPALFRKYD
ncbi:MAG: C1 family peptidase [Methanoregula sp.]|nr:C1 family peptidase [Methanoregula sp.]